MMAKIWKWIVYSLTLLVILITIATYYWYFTGDVELNNVIAMTLNTIVFVLNSIAAKYQEKTNKILKEADF